MPDAYRRIILKPADLTSEAASTLREALSASVDAQRQLASKSLHVLQFVGELRENDRAFFIEHEPADPLPVEALFDPDADRLEVPELMRVAGALFEALRAAHTGGEERPVVHGGICGGVLVRTADGIDKITDFGFAPAVCSALGVEAYLNLAAGAVDNGPPELCGTGVWEVLGPDEFERDDRLCAFIDPEKYGTQMLDTFEAGSDVISAGFVLHLLAEHRHPYLFNEPDAHRIPEMAEFMAMGRFNGARRKDMRESDDPGVRAWCDLVAKALSRLPRDRPSAVELAEAIGEYVKPPDASEILGRKLDALAKRVEASAPDEVDWAEVDQSARSIAEAEGVSPDVTGRAKSLSARARGRILLKRALELVGGDRWPQAAEPLAELRELPDLPVELAQEVASVRERFDRYQGAAQEIESIRADVPQKSGAAPYEARSTLKSLRVRAEGLPDDADLPESLRPPKTELLQSLNGQLDRVQADIERLESEAEAYLGRLRAALDAGEWGELSKLLDAPPELPVWPEAADSQVRKFRSRLEQHREEERLRAEIEADREAAEQWLGQLRSVVDTEEWAKARQLLDERPELTHWPEQVLAEEEELRRRAEKALKRESDHRQAREWLDPAMTAAEEGDWHTVDAVLGTRPELEYWPEEILKKEKLLREKLDKHRKELERQRRIREEQHAKARAWLESAEAAAREEAWAEAIDLLESPPKLDHWPEGLREEAARLDNACRIRLGEEIGETLRRRSEDVRSLAEVFVGRLLEREFQSLIGRKNIEAQVDAEEFTGSGVESDGRAELIVRAVDPLGEVDDPGLRVGFDFRLRSDDRGVLDEDEAIASQLVQHLRSFLIKIQRHRVQQVIHPLKSGLFPNAAIEVSLSEPGARATARVVLDDPPTKERTLDAKLAWDSTALAWHFADESSFAAAAWDIAVDSLRRALQTSLVSKSEPLKRYRSALMMKAVTEPPSELNALAGPLTFDLQFGLAANGSDKPGGFHSMPVSCSRVDKPPDDIDVSAAESALERAVATAQSNRRGTLTGQLRSRIKAKSPKVKLFANPRTISEPVDKISFELRARGHDPLTLEAAWDVESFEYRPVQDWNGSLEQYLELPVKGGPPVLPIGGGVVIVAIVGIVLVRFLSGNGNDEPQRPVDPTPDPAPVALSFEVSVDPPSLEVGEAATIGATVAGGAPPYTVCFGLEGMPDAGRAGGIELEGGSLSPEVDSARFPNTNCTCNEELTGESVRVARMVRTDNTASEGSVGVRVFVQDAEQQIRERLVSLNLTRPPEEPEEPPIEVPASPGLDIAVATVRGLLSESMWLDPIVDRLVREYTETDAPSLRYRIPGISDGWTSVEINLDPDGVAWMVPVAERERIAREVEDLERLLASTPEAEVAAFLDKLLREAPIVSPQLLDPSVVVGRTVGEPTWEPASADSRAWLGRIDAELVLRPAGVEGGRPPISVDEVAIELRDGRVSVADARSEFDASVKRDVEASLWDLQGVSSAVLLDRVEDGPLSGEVDLDTTPIEQPRSTFSATVSFSSLELQPRELTASWNPQSLEFSSDSWEAAVDEMEYSAAVVATIADLRQRQDVWINAVSSANLNEIAPPDAQGDWLLAIPSDGTTQLGGIDHPEVGNHFPLPTRWRIGDESPEGAAARIVSNANKPTYWPLVEAGLELVDKRLLPPDQRHARFVDALSGAATDAELVAYLQADSMAVPSLEISEAKLTSESGVAPESLSMAIESGWEAASQGVPEGLDAGCLSERFGAFGTVRGTVSVRIGDDGAFDWDLASGGRILSALARDLPKLRALQSRLSEWSARSQREAQLQRAASNPNGVTGADVVRLLNSIWSAKETAVTLNRQPQTLTDITRAIRDDFGLGGLWHEGKRGITPTVFVEYFTGVDHVYALAWSATVTGEFKESPRAMLLCSRDQLNTDQGNLGELLIGSVLRQFDDAIKAQQPGDWEGQIGLVLAPDQGFENIDLENLTFEEQLTRTDHTNPSFPPRPTRWSSLRALTEGVTSGYKADYRLTKSLGAPATEWSGQEVSQQTEADTWAAEVLADCSVP